MGAKPKLIGKNRLLSDILALISHYSWARQQTNLPNRSVLFRILFILQVVRLVLTYNFSNCNSEKILKIYGALISTDLCKDLDKDKFDQIKDCDSRPACLLKIEHYTLNPIAGCPSLPDKDFALRTKEALIHNCPGYSEPERNRTEEMAQEVENICRNQTLQILGLWFSFIQSPPQN
ncbi:thymic stromal lymphopoietin [Apodemus sylvaticus]|uniref:thymic stromal lymphopoietin n=1 Tax=Apodemus sylvaticus TaxID=10129 RepID=UPI00224416E3|nr:thymic stromal lymphopoietin [Apodemus sylvaticus]